MSQLDNTSAILGEYMLKGWTLTDLHCSECRVTPLMREPAAVASREGRERIQFCALCDGRPEGRLQASAPTSAPAPPSQAYTAALAQTSASSRQHSSLESDDSPAHVSAPSGPGPSQSDDAASSISSLLLRGYSMLGENCPNTQCRGIPLVGYPRKPDGSKDGRKMCVSCDGRWASQSSLDNGDLKVTSASASTPISTPASAAVPESPRSKARRELYGLDLTSTGSKPAVKEFEKTKGKGKQVDVQEFEQKARESAERLQRTKQDADVDMSMDMDLEDEENQDALAAAPAVARASHHISHTAYKPTAPAPTSALGQSLAQTSDSLTHTLQTLSTSLERHASHPPTNVKRAGEEVSGRWFVDLKLHTEAIKDVLGVISQVERAKRAGF